LSGLFYYFLNIRYLKLRKGHAGGSDMAEPSIDSAAKYVILEEMDEDVI